LSCDISIQPKLGGDLSYSNFSLLRKNGVKINWLRNLIIGAIKGVQRVISTLEFKCSIHFFFRSIYSIVITLKYHSILFLQFQHPQYLGSSCAHEPNIYIWILSNICIDSDLIYHDSTVLTALTLNKNLIVFVILGPSN
jgi:hypothetical protein